MTKEEKKEYFKKWYELNKQVESDNKKEYYLNNKEKLKIRGITYYKDNKSLIKKKKQVYKNRGYFKRRCQVDKLFKLSTNIRGLINCSFKNNFLKKNTKTNKILGCSFEEFKKYIEYQFEDWMNWDNYGKYTGNYNETWQFDHIIPVSKGKTEEEIIKLNHYTNFRPLCSKLNHEKRDKV